MTDLTYYPYGKGPQREIASQITTWKQLKTRYENELVKVRGEARQYPPDGVLSKIVEHLKNAEENQHITELFTQTHNRQRQLQGEISAGTSKYNDAIHRIAELLAKQNTDNTHVTMNRTILHDMLQATCPDFYVPDSAFVAGTDSSPQLSWKLQGIAFKPDGNRYPNVFNKSKDFPPIPLPEMTMTVWPTAAQIEVRHDTKVRSVKDAFHGYCRPHPHIMGNARPCLGGFENGTTSMFMCHDIATLNHIMVMFLQHTSHEDWAASNWPMWLYNHNSEKPKAHPTTVTVNETDWVIMPVVFADHADGKVSKTLKACIYKRNNIGGNPPGKEKVEEIMTAAKNQENKWWETAEVVPFKTGYFNFFYPEFQYHG